MLPLDTVRWETDFEIIALWMFARQELDPMDYSVVIQGGDDAFAAVVMGSYSLFDPTAAPEGYLDGTTASKILVSKSDDQQDISRHI